MALGIGLGLSYNNYFSKADWRDLRLTSPASGSLISEWWFNEGSGTTVADQVGSNDINLELPTNPNYSWVPEGVHHDLGLIQTPNVNTRTIVILARQNKGEASGFLISGADGNSGGGLLADQYTRPTWQSNGNKIIQVRGRVSTGANALSLNSGGWRLYFLENSSAFNAAWGFGGRRSTTTSRCTDFDIAWAAAFSGTLTSVERDQIFSMSRLLSKERGFYIHWSDCPVKANGIMLIGQSNAEGRAKLANLSGEDAAKTTPLTYISRRDTNTTALMVKGSNQQSDAPTTDFGPELGFAWQYEASNTKRLYISKHATGGTWLTNPTPTAPEWSVDNWDALASNNYLNKACRNWHSIVADAMDMGIGIQPKGVCWMQGEQDATNTTSAALYEARLTAVVARLRDQISDGLPFVIGRIVDTDPSADPVAVVAVRDAQEAVGGQSGNSWFDTDSFPLKVDLVHYDAVGAKALGEAFYSEIF